MATKKKTTAVAVQQPAVATAALVRRIDTPTQTIIEKLVDLSKSEGMDVAKINALIDAQVRIIAIGARQQFAAAFAEMQGELPVIDRNGRIEVTARAASGSDKARAARSTPFARLSDIQRAVQPVLARHGFSLRFQHELQDGVLVVTGYLSHSGGHFETDQFFTGRDDSGQKNVIQSWGSARTYAQRYLTISLLNVTSDAPQDRTPDDDGESAEERVEPRSETRPARQPTADDRLIISEPQRKRFWAIVANSGRSEAVVREWLLNRYKVDSTTKILRRDYDAICKAVESRANTLPGGREPGEEG
jgi:hypothetical protein